MRKHGGTPSRRDKHVTLAAISSPGVARGRFVGGHQSGLAGCKPPPLFMRGASFCSSQGRRQGEPWGASLRPSAPTYLPTYGPEGFKKGPKQLYLHFLHTIMLKQAAKVREVREKFITRTQAKVDAKLTQSRLLRTLSPSKFENDPLHPPLHLGPSRGGQSSNITSDHELKDVAKELFPATDDTGNAAKEKEAQGQQVKPLTPPTGSENILDPEPEGTRKNTEGNHSSDANELEQQEACHVDPCEDAAINNSATSDDNMRKINKDKPYNSLLAPREEHSSPSIIRSPYGTHKETEEGEDLTSDEENGNAERPSFNPSLNPDGVFEKFLVKHKGDINVHDQPALWGETCAQDTLGIDTYQLVLEQFYKQIIYNQFCPTIDLCASDLCSFLHGMDCSGNNAY